MQPISIDHRLDEAVKIIVKGNPDYLSEATAKLLNFEPRAGQKVVAVSDVIYQQDGGLYGTVVGPKKGNPGFVDIKLENGTIVPVASNLVVPV